MNLASRKTWALFLGYQPVRENDKRGLELNEKDVLWVGLDIVLGPKMMNLVP